MPIYEYRCVKCGDFDVMQKITAGPLRKCPTCKAKVTKLMSSTAFQLKGSGWYVTDYGKGGKKSGSSESGTPKAESTTASTSSSETKASSPGAKSGGSESPAAA